MNTDDPVSAPVPPPILSIVGRSGTGKTTYLERLIPELSRRGVRVAVVKHHPGSFEIDQPGKNTWRYAQAGAFLSAISGPDRFALVERRDRELTLDELAVRVSGVDLLITEGYKRDGRNRIELLRRAHSVEPVCAADEVLARIADFAPGDTLPLFPLDDPVPLADFIERSLLRR